MEMRGLSNFIQEVRKASNTSKEAEQRRIEEELAKIRSKFRSSNSSSLSAYDRKKYVTKLMFISVLGYTVDFGHIEGVQLLSGSSESEKLIGYLSLAVFLNAKHELLTLTTNTIHGDLTSNNEFLMALALSAIGNVGGKDFSEAMGTSVKRVLLARGVSPNITKKAVLTYLHMYRMDKSNLQEDVIEVLPTVIDLMKHSHMGLASCAATFVQGVMRELLPNAALGEAAVVAPEIRNALKHVPRQCVAVLEAIVMRKATEADYLYYSVPAPWLQVQVLRILQYVPCPSTDNSDAENAADLLAKTTVVFGKVLQATERVIAEAQTHQRQRGTLNRSTIMTAILVELISVIMRWEYFLQSHLLQQCAELIVGFLHERKEANLQFVGLNLASRLGVLLQKSEIRQATSPLLTLPGLLTSVEQSVVVSLHTPDISVRKKALNLLYTLCTPANADQVVGELLDYLVIATTSQSGGGVRNVAAIRGANNNEVADSAGTSTTNMTDFIHEVIIYIAVLAEKFCADDGRFCEILLSLLECCCTSSVSTDASTQINIPPKVWQELVHSVMRSPNIQKHITANVFNSVRMRLSGTSDEGSQEKGGAAPITSTPPPLSDVLIRVCGMLLGEFGYQIATSAGSTPLEQVQLIQSCLFRGAGGVNTSNTFGSSMVTVETTAVLLTSLAKLFNFFADQPVREAILKVISNPIFTRNINTEVQQRACEFCALLGAVLTSNPDAPVNSNTPAPDTLIQAIFDVTPAYFPKPTNNKATTYGIMLEELISCRQGSGGSRDLWLEELAARDAAYYQQSFQARQLRAAAATK